jgi:hypothetical protein
MQAASAGKRGRPPKNRQAFYWKHHNLYPTEHEANLVRLFELIKNRQYQYASETVFICLDYLQKFDHKQFIKKAADYGVTNQQLVEFKKDLVHEIADQIEHNNFPPFLQKIKQISKMVGLE